MREGKRKRCEEVEKHRHGWDRLTRARTKRAYEQKAQGQKELMSRRLRDGEDSREKRKELMTGWEKAHERREKAHERKEKRDAEG